MSKSLNSVVIHGNLTADPEVKQFDNGSVASLRLALNRSRKVGEEWVEETDYVDIAVWGRQAELCADRLHKGSRVLIDGSLRSRSWEQDGQKRSKLEVIANDVHFLDKLEADQ